MISVCLCTYNGEKYIKQQLDCIRQQIETIDEVIICDDVSSDDTVQVIRNYIAQYHLEDSWKLYVNQENKGYPGNFYYAMGLCRGDIVFLADQDDLWVPEKTRVMNQVMSDNENIQVLSCTMGIVDAQGTQLKGILAPKKSDNGKTEKITMENTLYRDCWAGMTLAYRRTFFERVEKEISTSKLPHDRALWTLAAQSGGFYQVNRILAFHRRHDSNTCKEEHRIGKVMRLHRKIEEIDVYLGYLQEFMKIRLLTSDAKTAIQKKILIMGKRRDNLLAGRIGRVMADYWRYRKDVRLSTVLCDIGIIMTGR